MNCCFGPKREPPFDIEPGATEELACTVEVEKPGPFSSQVHVYLDDGGLREIVLTIQGDAQPAK